MNLFFILTVLSSWVPFHVVPPTAEITVMSMIMGVDPTLALAISDQETGSAPERCFNSQNNSINRIIKYIPKGNKQDLVSRSLSYFVTKPRGECRDKVVSLGNVGRFQINATSHWKNFGYHSRVTAIRFLKNRHVNILTGISLIHFSVFQCGNKAAECYNAGHRGTAQGRIYQRAVIQRKSRLLPARTS